MFRKKTSKDKKAQQALGIEETVEDKKKKQPKNVKGKDGGWAKDRGEGGAAERG